jgi:hypothetical protein
MRGPDADNMYCHLECDERLFEQRILRALERPQPIHRSIPNEIESDVERFYNWLLLNYACGGPVTVTYDMLKTCVENKLAGCLGHLLGNYFTMTTTNDWKWRDNWRSMREPEQNVTERRRKTTVTEEDLVRLRDMADELWWDKDCVRLVEAELSHIEDMKTMARTEGFASWQEAECSYYREREQGALMERLHYDSDEDASLADELSSQRSDFSDDDEEDSDSDSDSEEARASQQRIDTMIAECTAQVDEGVRVVLVRQAAENAAIDRFTQTFNEGMDRIEELTERICAQMEAGQPQSSMQAGASGEI